MPTRLESSEKNRQKNTVLKKGICVTRRIKLAGLDKRKF